MLLSVLFTLAGLVSLTTASYVLEDDYESNSFFSIAPSSDTDNARAETLHMDTLHI
jgi:hypothetical protein